MKQAVVTIKYDEEKLNAVKQYMGKKDADFDAELKEVLGKMYEKYVPQALSVNTLKAEGMCRLQSKRQTASREKTVRHPAVLRRMSRERRKHGQDKDSESRAGETSLCEGDCE